MKLEEAIEYLKKFNKIIISWNLNEKCDLSNAIETVLKSLEE